jgi:hypothetical protein
MMATSSRSLQMSNRNGERFALRHERDELLRERDTLRACLRRAFDALATAAAAAAEDQSVARE